MSQTTDPKYIQDWNLNYANDPVPPDFKILLDRKASLDQQLLNLPASHPSRAALVAQQATVVAAISAHPKNSK